MVWEQLVVKGMRFEMSGVGFCGVGTRVHFCLGEGLEKVKVERFCLGFSWMTLR